MVAAMRTEIVKEKYSDSIDTVTKAIQENSKNSEDAMLSNNGKYYNVLILYLLCTLI